MRNVLPTGWQAASLADVCDVEMGQSPPSDTYNEESIGLPFFQGKAEFTDLYPVVKKWCSKPGKLARKDDILLSVRAPVGPTNLAPSECCIGRGLAALTPKTGVATPYVLQAIRSFQNDLAKLGSGSTFEAISGKDVREFTVPIAPTAEQERIVAKIEELFSDLDAGVAALERARANLKRYRAAVLKAAVEGKFSRRSSNVTKADTWVPIFINSAIAELDQGWSPKCAREPSNNAEAWGVIKTTAVQPLGYLEVENKMLPSSLRPRPHLEIRKKDLLITRAGPRSRVGITCLVRETRPRLLLCDKVYRIRVRPTVAREAFLELVLNAPQIMNTLNELKTGISDSGVNLTQKKLRELKIPIPPLSEQDQTVAEVQRHISVVEKVEAELSARLLLASRLRQSILKRAFEGKLVPQDPSDEPASVLLERIRTTRTKEQRGRNERMKKTGVANQ